MNTSKAISIFLVFLFSLAACKKMDDNYQEYVVPEGITYPGKVNNPILQSGKERVLIKWPAGVDPSVVKSHIYWNNYSDSVIVDIPEGIDTIRVYIEPLPEGSYSFIVHTYDSNGNTSVPVEINGTVYGDMYFSSISPRIVKLLELDPSENTVFINWEPADITNGAGITEIKYTDTGNNEQVISVETEDMETMLPGFKVGSTFSYRTQYKPDSTTLDIFYTDFQENINELTLKKGGMSVVAFSSQVNADAANIVGNVIDGINNNRWHTANNPFPHFVTVDLGGEAMISKLGVWASTVDVGGAPGFDVRQPGRITIEVSTDNNEWTDLGEFEFATRMEQYFNFSPTLARYFRFTGLDRGPSNTVDYMVIGELDFYCK